MKIDNYYNVLLIVTTEDLTQEQYDMLIVISEAMYFNVTPLILRDISNFKDVFNNSTTPFNVVYVFGHGDEKGTIIGDDDLYFYWSDIINEFNSSGFFNEDTLLYIQGCDSINATDTIFNLSKHINRIVCFEGKVVNMKAYISFINFIYYTRFLNLDEPTAIDKVKSNIYPYISFVQRERKYKEH